MGRVRFCSPEHTQRSARTLAQLLDSQGAAFKKDPRSGILQKMLDARAPLRQARLSRQAWRLLNEPRLQVQFVHNFIETYRQPKDLFYQLFLELKWDIKNRSAVLRSERSRRIVTLCGQWPQPIQNMTTWLQDCERLYNRSVPICSQAFTPHTLKVARLMSLWGWSHWQHYLEKCINDLCVRYPNLLLPPVQDLLDWMVLESLPPVKSIRRPSVSALKAGWRHASKRWHPDCTTQYKASHNTEWFCAAENAACRLGIR